MFHKLKYMVKESSCEYEFVGLSGSWFKSYEKKEATPSDRRIILGREFQPYSTYKRGSIFNRKYEINWVSLPNSPSSVEDIAYLYKTKILEPFLENNKNIEIKIVPNRYISSKDHNEIEYTFIGKEEAWFKSIENKNPKVKENRCIYEVEFYPFFSKKIKGKYEIMWIPVNNKNTFEDMKVFFNDNLTRQLPSGGKYSDRLDIFNKLEKIA